MFVQKHDRASGASKRNYLHGAFAPLFAAQLLTHLVREVHGNLLQEKLPDSRNDVFGTRFGDEVEDRTALQVTGPKHAAGERRRPQKIGAKFEVQAASEFGQKRIAAFGIVWRLKPFLASHKYKEVMLGPTILPAQEFANHANVCDRNAPAFAARRGILDVIAINAQLHTASLTAATQMRRYFRFESSMT